jgi:hypothetical protein
MNSTTTVIQMLVRLCGVILVILGVLFWSGNALSLIPVHMLVGLLLVLLLWTQAVIAARAGVSPGLVALAAIWGLVVPALGVTQTGLLPGDLHWLIQILHLLVGIVAIVLAESLAQRTKSRRSAGSAAEPRAVPA